MHIPEPDQIRFGDAVIDYEIRRSSRRHKTLELSAGRHGVRVAVPMATPRSEIADFVRHRVPWILERLAAAAAAAIAAEQNPPSIPARLPYLGRHLDVCVNDDAVGDIDVRFRPWELQVSLPASLTGGINGDDAPGDDASEMVKLTTRAITEWYWLRACEHVPIAVDRWWPLLGRGDKGDVVVADQRRRWGSCAGDGTLRFNWRLVMLDPALFDYIVVHELAHLSCRGHGEEFWNLVASMLPDVKERRAALRAAERTLRWHLVA